VLSGKAQTPQEQTLTRRLGSAKFRADEKPRSWLDALSKAFAKRTAAEGPSEPVAGMNAQPPESPTPTIVVAVPVANSVHAAYEGLGLSISDPEAARRTLFSMIDSALPKPVASEPPDGGEQAQTPAQPRRNEGAVYVTRLVYERPKCAEAHRLTISAPSGAFRLAHFYDPDAPFRDNRIVLPVDTSLAGLRKFPKAVKVELSAQLRRQVARIEEIKLKDLDSGEIPPEGGGSLGMVCSLSIPIITICALILLMIIVSVLNIVFFWVPLFKICLPKADG
jgi:hypothetical protein